MASVTWTDNRRTQDCSSQQTKRPPSLQAGTPALLRDSDGAHLKGSGSAIEAELLANFLARQSVFLTQP